MQTQTSNNLHDAIMEAGNKDRPPMLAPGNYTQWKSRIKRYINTKPNHELIHYCLKNPPYKLTWADKEVLISKGSSVTTTKRYMETYKNVSQDIRNQLNAESEAVQIILTGIDNDIYSTVDASQQAATRNKGKSIVNSPIPIYDQEPSMVAEDDEIGAGYDNQRLGNVVGARETVGITVVQKSRIQCYNYKEFGHVARECQKPKRAKDVAYHREKMLLCKQEEAGIQLNAKQADWRDDTDDESKDQDWKHIICEIKDFKNKNISLESSNNHFKEANNKLSETNKLLYDDFKKLQAELDKCNDVEYASKVEIDCAKAKGDLISYKMESFLYASKVEIDCAKAKGDLISYKMESQKSFNKYTQKINELNQTISEMRKKLSAHQETISILSQAKEAQIKLYKTHEDKELDEVIALENKVKIGILNLFRCKLISVSSICLDDDSGADMNNLDTNLQVSPVPTTRIHKDHPLEQFIRDLHSAPQTRRMSKNLEEHSLVSSKWVYRNKLDKRGIMIRNKARLVAQGHKQKEGINYDEVSAPVARTKAIRLLIAYASFKDFVVYQMDVKSAFLYKKIEEEVYVCQPLGFEYLDFLDKVYKVEKALYGLHQTPRAWYEILSTYSLDNEFQRGMIDNTLFIKRDKTNILLVQVYVDDIIFGSTKKEMCTEFEKMMHKKFQISFIGELTFFLGLQVKQNEDGIFISQDKYVNEILTKFGFSNVKTASTPIEAHKSLLKDEK
nr:copia protein [Tanacetum cinerariifolium]